MFNGTKKVLDNMFGFIFKQPIYKSLRQMCIIQVSAIVVNFILLVWLLNWYMANATELDASSAAGLFAFCTTIFTTTWLALANITQERNKENAELITAIREVKTNAQ